MMNEKETRGRSVAAVLRMKPEPAPPVFDWQSKDETRTDVEAIVDGIRYRVMQEPPPAIGAFICWSGFAESSPAVDLRLLDEASGDVKYCGTLHEIKAYAEAYHNARRDSIVRYDSPAAPRSEAHKEAAYIDGLPGSAGYVFAGYSAGTESAPGPGSYVSDPPSPLPAPQGPPPTPLDPQTAAMLIKTALTLFGSVEGLLDALDKNYPAEFADYLATIDRGV